MAQILNIYGNSCDESYSGTNNAPYISHLSVMDSSLTGSNEIFGLVQSTDLVNPMNHAHAFIVTMQSQGVIGANDSSRVAAVSIDAGDVGQTSKFLGMKPSLVKDATGNLQIHSIYGNLASNQIAYLIISPETGVITSQAKILSGVDSLYYGMEAAFVDTRQK